MAAQAAAVLKRKQLKEEGEEEAAAHGDKEDGWVGGIVRRFFLGFF